MIPQAATILCFWIFLYPTEAIKTKSTKRSLCDIQTSLWLFSVPILPINPRFEISFWPPPMLPRQSSSMLGKCHFFLLCRFPTLFLPHKLPFLTTQTVFCIFLIQSLYYCPTLLLLSHSWLSQLVPSPSATSTTLMTKSHKTLKETQDTSKTNLLPQRRLLLWLYQLIFNFH